MDIYCPVCQELWDLDSLHDEAEGSSRTFSKVRADFYERGCAALTTFGSLTCEPVVDERSAVISLAYELMGDDVDGAASMLDDATALGLL